MSLGAIMMLAPVAVFGILTPVVEDLSKKLRSQNLPAYWCIAGLLTSLIGSIALLQSPVQPTILAGALILDNLSIFFSIVFLIVTLLIAVASLPYMGGERNLGAYYGLLMMSTLGMMLVAFAIDILTLYIAWELMSIPTYVLAGIKKGDPTSNEAAVKYFVVSALSSALIVYALSITFGITGTTNLHGVATRMAEALPELQPLAMLATILFIAGFGMKVAAVPFHMWVPDAYEGAPATIGALLAAGAKNGGFAAMIRVFPIALLALRLNWTASFAFIALMTMTLGNIAALMQRSLPRLLAYSSIAHAGYILIGFAAPSILGLSGALYHILNHGVMKTTAFIAAAAVSRALATTALDDYKGLGRRMPVTSVTLSFALLALAGVPPLNGFMSKLILFTAAVGEGLAWLALAGILNSAFSMAYYGWIIKRMYFDESPAKTRLEEPLPFVIALTGSTLLMIATGIAVEPLVTYMQAAVAG